MGIVNDLAEMTENMRFEFLKDGSGVVHQVNRIAEHGKHRKISHMSNGSKSSEEWITPEEFESMRSSMSRSDHGYAGVK